MSDAMYFSSIAPDWLAHAGRVAQLFRSVPVQPQERVLVMVSEKQAQLAIALACGACEAQPVLLDVAAAQKVVQEVFAQYQASVVVCDPTLFGWVSKMAFVGGSKAVYTCSAEGEGSLLARAVHFAAKEDLQPLVHHAPAPRAHDAQGQLRP